MKRLFVALAILTPWITQSMEPQVAYAQDIPVETATEDAGRWVRLVEEILPGEIPLRASTRISQILAQKLLIQKPHIRQYILSHLSLPFKNFSAKPGKNCSLYYSPAGDKVITLAQRDRRGRVPKIWDAQTGKLLFTLKGHVNGPSITFNPNGDKILTHSIDTARLWDTQTGKLLHTMESPEDFICGATFNPNGDKILTWSEDRADKTDRTARIWEVQTGKLLFTLGEPSAKPYLAESYSAKFNPNGDTILTYSRRTARIWDTQTGRPIHTLWRDNSDTKSNLQAAFNLDGKKIIALYDFRTARGKIWEEWDTETGKLVQTFQIWHVWIGRDLKTFRFEDGTYKGDWYRPKTEKFISYEAASKITANDFTWQKILERFNIGQYGRVKFNSTGDLIMEANEIGKKRIWDPKTGEVLKTFETGITRDRSWKAMFDPTGEKLVIASTDGTYKIWDLEPLLSCKKFLVEEIGHLQAALLLDIFQVIETRHYANVLCQIEASLVNQIKIEQNKGASPEAQNTIARTTAKLNKLKRAASLKNITFDFNWYPHLWDMYEAMPEAIRTVCDPYITKPSFEQDLKRPSSSPEQPSKRLKIATENIQ